MNNEVEVSAKKIYKRKLIKRLIEIFVLILIVLLAIVYLFLYVVYEGGRFTVTLDRNLSNRKNVYISEKIDYKTKNRKLAADTIDYMDNISVEWLPENIGEGSGGSHNGDNYVAYTFYVLNAGDEAVNYWYEIDVDDSIKRLDEAIRVMVVHNGVKTIYAKESATGEAEKGTEKFKTDSRVVLKERKSFQPKSNDKITVVIWLEGDDPECNNDLLGGEIRMHMDITEEHTEESSKK